MNLETFIIKAFQNHAAKRLDWVRSLLCLINEDMEAYKEDPYPYRIIQRRDGIFFVDPEQDGELTKLTGVDVSKELAAPSTPIIIPASAFPNVTKDTKTVVGNLMFNYYLSIYPFGSKIPFLTGVLSIKDLEKEIIKRMKGKKDAPDFIPVEEYIKYTRGLKFFEELSDIIIPTASAKTITPPPGIIQLRNKLLKDVTDTSNPVELARVDKELIKHDAEYLKGDEAADGFLNSAKSRNEVRRKLFLTLGAQAGFGDGVTVTGVARSLNEGVDAESMAAMNSSARSGSFNRGHQTMLGGAIFKVLIRSASNIKIAEEDCGSKIGPIERITTENYKNYEGRYVIVNGQTEKFDASKLDRYVNKNVMTRSARYCKSKGTTLCRCCAGDGLADHPDGIAVAVSDVGSAFLTLFLKKMHVSGLTTTKADYKVLIS